MTYDKQADPRHVEKHYVVPLDAYEDGFKCTCGRVFRVEVGFAICPTRRWHPWREAPL